MWALLFLLISIILLTTNFEANEQGKKILFYGQNQLGTWDIPEYGKYGREAYGMFGMLPIYLKASGYDSSIIVQNITTFVNTTQPIHENITRFVNLTDYVNLIESYEITDNILQNFNVLVVTNLNLSFSKAELNSIWNFVENGGSLLVLGDHTNVGEIQKPLNDLLEPSGIKFRFDSALPLDSRSKWQNCYQFFNHQINSKIKSLDEIQISVGASLDPDQSIPVVIGRYALSDKGDRSNIEMAYLGDYEYNHGEQIGDVVLVAGMNYGGGKVLVFGDTSTFQNSAIPYSFYFIENMFKWLVEKGSQTAVNIQLGLAVIFIMLTFIFYYYEKTNHIIYELFPLILIFSLLLSTVLIPAFHTEEELNGNIVFIDTTHKERFTIDSFTDDSINGLILNLNRNGFLPLFLRDFSIQKMNQAKILIFNAPTELFDASEVDFLTQYIYQGGIVILATGYEDRGASKLLLERFNLEIEEIPLGPVPYVEENPEEYENEPRFVDSWPILFQKETTKPYYNFTWERDYNLMVYVEHGSGGLLLISDSQYLLDKNIESIYDYWPGNIIFLKHILDNFKERGIN